MLALQANNNSGSHANMTPVSVSTDSANPVTIALDAMGGDHGAEVVVPAAVRASQVHDGLRLILVGDEEIIGQQLRAAGAEADGERLRVQHASQVVEMDDLPSQALRGKKDSSMRVAINLVKQGEADACVSAGNTGALMAIGRFVLKTISGIDRPAICSALPTINSCTYVLDLGANVDVSADNLFEFAVMGSVLASAITGKAQPAVGLLNIGAEEIKGNEKVKEAARMLADSSLNYIGFVEGDDIYQDRADVIVCDGFNGNVALKASEGIAKMISQKLRAAFMESWWTRLCGLAAYPVLMRFRRTIDPRRYNGASLLGLQGIVVKSHGGADKLAFKTAIDHAILEVRNDVPERIAKQLETTLGERR